MIRAYAHREPVSIAPADGIRMTLTRRAFTRTYAPQLERQGLELSYYIFFTRADFELNGGSTTDATTRSDHKIQRGQVEAT